MKALVLISGGLDSLLAAELVKGEGIKVTGLRFKIPFYLKKIKTIPDIGIEIKEIDIGQDCLKFLLKPAHGFGSCLNPCIDCKILMLAKAKELLKESGARFVVTGEVLGQRPMSQNRKALELIAREAGMEGLVLRPLSARLLAETIPQKKGWIGEGALLNFSGRSRKPQIALAKTLGIEGFPQPAGGCLLTDPQFSNRLKDLMLHQELDAGNLELLKTGRHFRIAERAKLIIGRNEEEGRELESLARKGDYLFFPAEEVAGPTALGRGDFEEELIRLSCRIISSYCDLEEGAQTPISVQRPPAEKKTGVKVCVGKKEKYSDLRV